MRLFNKRQTQTAITDSEVKNIQERVRTMRRQIGKCDIELADLFALVREDERPVLREIREVRRPEIARVWPDQVPSQPKTMPEVTVPSVTYGDWELLRRKGLVTLP